VKLADQFLDNDKLIVYTQGIHSKRDEYKSTPYGLFEKGKLLILIDESSASASEILSGAIQDWDRGYIVGRRSFGKGLVQRPLMFPDGSMLKLTVARYYTPSGRSIQKPYNKGNEEYEKDILNRYNKGEFINKDSIHFPDSLKYYTLVDKRVVYGGGGIMPDFFVPIDTTGYTNYYRDIVRKGIVNKFVLNYIDQNRGSIKTNYPDIATFDKAFNTDTVVSQMLIYAGKEGLKPNLEQINISRPSLSKLVKAFIARDIWDSNEFYEIYNKDEPMIKEALDVIHNWDSKRKELLNNRK
jgi:carboxyl-terminal processing protease